MATKKTVKAEKKFVPELGAKLLAPNSLLRLSVEPRTVFQNAKTGLANLRAAQDIIERSFKQWDSAALVRCSAINSAFLARANEVADSETKTDPQLAKDTARAWALRRLLFAQIDAAVAAEVIAEAEVAPIRRGTGLVDCSKDCLALVKLFRKHAAAIGKKTFVSEAQLSETSEVASRLQATLKSKAAKLTAAEVVKARDMRDRLYTLLSQEYESLWSVAAVVFGRDHLPVMFPDLAQHSAVRHEVVKTVIDAPAVKRKASAKIDQAVLDSAPPTIETPALKEETAKK